MAIPTHIYTELTNFAGQRSNTNDNSKQKQEMRTIFLIFAILWGIFPTTHGQTATDRKQDTFRMEADRFLAAMPSGLQDRQTGAILKAIKGDTAELAAVRASRNTTPPRTELVNALQITPSLRLYTPVKKNQSPLPLLIYLHGGGWTFGSINSCARFCQTLAATGNVIVLAVDYRLAPEHPFPDGLEDCIRAVKLARKKALEWGSSPELVSIGGDSAGGNLALSATLSFLQEGTSPIRSLLLFYPVVSAWNDASPSWNTYQKGAALDGPLMEAFNQAYTQGQATHPMASPSLCPDSLLSRLPRMLLVAAERDILCDQGKAFTDHVKRLGVTAHREVLPGTVHLFITVPGQDTAFRHAVSLAEDFLRP